MEEFSMPFIKFNNINYPNKINEEDLNLPVKFFYFISDKPFIITYTAIFHYSLS
jgi:hypothetical protein